MLVSVVRVLAGKWKCSAGAFNQAISVPFFPRYTIGFRVNKVHAQP